MKSLFFGGVHPSGGLCLSAAINAGSGETGIDTHWGMGYNGQYG